MDSLPSDLYYAAGAMGQRVAVIPSYDLVIVRLGYSLNTDFEARFEGVLAGILGAFKKNSVRTGSLADDRQA